MKNVIFKLFLYDIKVNLLAEVIFYDLLEVESVYDCMGYEATPISKIYLQNLFVWKLNKKFSEALVTRCSKPVFDLGL